MGSRYKFCGTGSEKKTVRLSIPASNFLARAKEELRDYVRTVSQADIVEVLVCDLKARWGDNKTRTELLDKIWKF